MTRMINMMMKTICCAIFTTILIILPTTSYLKAAKQHAASAEDQAPPRIITNIRYALQPDGVYASDTTSDRTLDLYLPANRSTDVPVILFIHGGGFSGGDKYGTRSLCQRLSQEGFGVISINYRLYLKHHKNLGASASANMSKGLPDSRQFHSELEKAIKIASDDAYLALQWVIKNASAYNLDSERLAISGGSAGAMTALYSAYVNPDFGGNIKAVVNLWGGMSDESKIRPGSPPLLTYHGDKDVTIHVNYAYALDRRMKEVGSRESKIFVLENMGHALYKYITSDRCPEIAAFLNEVL